SIYESVADALAERVALIQGDRERTWAEVDDRAARLAAAFSAAGLKPGSKVASYLYNSSEYMEGLLGTWKVRAVPVNVNYRCREAALLSLPNTPCGGAAVFHGSAGDFARRAAPRAAKRKLLAKVDAGPPLVDGAVE